MLFKEKIYYAVPTKKSSLDWLSRNEVLSRVYYEGGELLAVFDENFIKVYYKSGNIAIDVKFYCVQGVKLRRFVILEDGCDAPLGILDNFGRGIIFDHAANVRLKYNQIDAVLIDHAIGTPRIWKWVHEFERPIFENVITDTYLIPPDEEIELMKRKLKPNNERGMKETLATTPKNNKINDKPQKGKVLDSIVEEKENVSVQTPSILPIRPNSKAFRMFKIMPVFVKINKYFTLVMCDQQTISLRFSYDKKIMRIELGIQLFDQLLETDLVDPAIGTTLYDELPPKTESIAALQNCLRKVKESNSKRQRGTSC